MKLQKSKSANINYLSKIVEIKGFTPHPNPTYTKLKVAHVDGFNLVVSIDMEPGVYVYFPVMSQINPDLLSYLSLYRDASKNKDSKKKGFFENDGRVRAIRLGGFASEGFLMPVQQLKDWILDSVNVELEDVFINTEFDEAEHNGKTFWISKKYIIIQNNKTSQKNSGAYRNNKLKKFNKLIDGQFKFHYDTVLIRKEPWVISPSDLISITSKWHGTSLIAANVLCRHPRKKWDKLMTKLYKFFGGTLPEYTNEESYPEYDYIYSSRSVIKNNNINPTTGEGFYQTDVWKYGFEYLKPYLQKGMTIYAEICGFLPNGQYIQKGFDYGCIQPKDEEHYEPEVNFKVRVYRITLTNIYGIVHEFSAKEVQDYCKNVGLIPVNEFYYGLACDLYPNIVIDDNWSDNFIQQIADDKNFFMEKDSPDCINKMPQEGVVIKKEDGIPHAWKLKCFAFLNKEQEAMDKGISNVEDEN